MFLAAEELNIKLENSVYVGDHQRDIEAGNAAKMITVTAEYGYIPLHEMPVNWQASYTIQQPMQLKQLFLS